MQPQVDPDTGHTLRLRPTSQSRVPQEPLAIVQIAGTSRWEVWADCASPWAYLVAQVSSPDDAEEIAHWTRHHAMKCLGLAGECQGFQKVLEAPGIAHVHLVACEDIPDCPLHPSLVLIGCPDEGSIGPLVTTTIDVPIERRH